MKFHHFPIGFPLGFPMVYWEKSPGSWGSGAPAFRCALGERHRGRPASGARLSSPREALKDVKTWEFNCEDILNIWFYDVLRYFMMSYVYVLMILNAYILSFISIYLYLTW